MGTLFRPLKGWSGFLELLTEALRLQTYAACERNTPALTARLLRAVALQARSRAQAADRGTMPSSHPHRWSWRGSGVETLEPDPQPEASRGIPAGRQDLWERALSMSGAELVPKLDPAEPPLNSPR